MSDELRFEFGERDGSCQKFFEGSGLAIADTTRNDEIEVTKIGRNVIGKAM